MRGTLVLAIALIGIAAVAPTARGADALEATECHQAFFGGIDGAECYILEVPERHNERAGRQIRLRVAILRASDEPSAPDPILFLAGGPGAIAAESAREWAASNARTDRDIILLEQRGTPLSDPYLGCPALDRHESALSADPGEDASYAAVIAEAAAACADAYVADGVDLTAYSTRASAADVDLLRRALGVATWNLYGVSYGTRVALEVMRSFPDSVRVAILDGVDGPGVDRYAERTPRLSSALAAADEACDADTECRSRFGDLAGLAARAFDRWRASDAFVPAPIGPDSQVLVRMRPSVVAGVVNTMLASDPSRLPLALEQLAEGRTLLVELTSYEPMVQAEGLRLSVECAESVRVMDAQQRAAGDATAPDLATAFERYPEDVACAVWPGSVAVDVSRDPVQSDVPVLLISGALDPITPPSAAVAAAARLSNARHHVVPMSGHGSGFADPCTVATRDAFVADPAARAPACRAGLGPFRTDVQANAALSDRWRAVFAPQPSEAAFLPASIALGAALVLAVLGAAWHLIRGAREARWWLLLSAGATSLLVGFGLFQVWSDEATRPDGIFGLPDAALWVSWLATIAALLAVALVVTLVIAWTRRPSRVRPLVANTVLALAPIIATFVIGSSGLLLGFPGVR